MKNYILLLHMPIPRYFAGDIIHNDNGLLLEVEWTINMSMATPLTYEEIKHIELWCMQYQSISVTILRCPVALQEGLSRTINTNS